MKDWRPFRRLVTGVALVATPICLFAAEAAYPGHPQEDGEELIALAARETTQIHVAAILWFVAVLLMIPAATTAMRLTRDRSALTASLGGGLLVVGYVCSLMPLIMAEVAVGINNYDISLTPGGRLIEDSQIVLDAMFILFALGNLIGTPLMGTAMLRARVVPVWAAAVFIAWPALHITGLVSDVRWFAVVGFALQIPAFGLLGLSVLRGERESGSEVEVAVVDRARIAPIGA
ncbi:MAG: hypothetical protein OEW31_09090 [Thermoleophilia bacterium]|nr:hypothetical protein [Thermoleophilia bacterium]MDH4346476.1 hypothetical protein [Thermoleophilia bacterium]